MRARSTAGFTLIEVMVSVAILAISGLGTLGLIYVLTRSNEHVGGQTDALALATQLMAEIQNAPFLASDDPTSPSFRDPGLSAVGPQFAPIAGSSIRTVGRFNPGDPNPVPAGQSAFYNVSYEVLSWDDPITGRQGGVEVLVTVDNDASVQRGGDRVSERTIPQRLLNPVQLVIRKELLGSPVVSNGGQLRW